MTVVWNFVRREPVRFYLYGVLVAGEVVAYVYDVLGEAQGVAWLGLGAAVLGVPAVELARSQVRPVNPPPNKEGA